MQQHLFIEPSYTVPETLLSHSLEALNSLLLRCCCQCFLLSGHVLTELVKHQPALPIIWQQLPALILLQFAFDL
jgi:hypothetical protein